MASSLNAWRARIAAGLFLVASFSSTAALAQSEPAKVDPALAARLKNVMVPLLQKMDRPIPLDQVKVALADDNSINAGNAGGGGGPRRFASDAAYTSPPNGRPSRPPSPPPVASWCASTATRSPSSPGTASS